MYIDNIDKCNIKLTCQTPTVALAIRMRRMTSGSTNAVMTFSSSLCSSNKANTYFRRKTSLV
jgi:hypothetical protein